MKLLSVLSECDRLKPNHYTQKQKRAWLERIEMQIRDYAALYSVQKGSADFCSQENPELFLPDSRCDIYIYYLFSMINLNNQESALYNNSCALLNGLLSTWQKEYRRENTPKANTPITN